ncbi:hypothetical protein K0M31_014660 [Melipona bicolor]|uniref:Cytochrome b-c1 complex subunit 8 n=1 Tax=Melipona bicolor TaxID=60889 RepID=A0AA40FH05_9HYME|nr:hypothetical protein K0M31_014660 [Melipona bicolor]
MLEFGELPIRIRKVVYFTLCATHQRSWAKAISHGLPNFFKRSGRTMIPMVPGFLLTFWCMKWSVAENKKSKRKNPKLYEKDT